MINTINGKSSLKIREEEYNHFTQTTRKIIRCLKCLNGKVDNYSALIETCPDKNQFLSFIHSYICHPCSASSQPISLKTDQFGIRNLHLIEQFLHYQDSTTFRDIIDDSVDEFKSTKDTIQPDDSDSESKEDENMSYDVLNILIDEIVSPVIEQFKEIGTSSKIAQYHLSFLKITKKIQGALMLNLFLLKAL